MVCQHTVYHENRIYQFYLTEYLKHITIHFKEAGTFKIKLAFSFITLNRQLSFSFCAN